DGIGLRSASIYDRGETRASFVRSGEPMTLTPSDRARQLLRGAYDTHIHVGPDVVPRIVDDLTLARRFQALGLAGFVLKSHYTSTAERASVVSAAVPEVRVLGAIALNRAVGGMNPLAGELAARGGGPTPGAKVPVWVKLQLELREQGIEIEPVPVVDAGGAVLPQTRTVLATIARHPLVLATGHFGRDEIFALVGAAL